MFQVVWGESVGLSVSSELARIWKEALGALPKLLFRLLPGKTEENCECFRSYSLLLNRGLKPGLVEYKTGVLPGPYRRHWHAS